MGVRSTFQVWGMMMTGALDFVQWLLSAQTPGAGHRPHSLADGRLGARGQGLFQSPLTAALVLRRTLLDSAGRKPRSCSLLGGLS